MRLHDIVSYLFYQCSLSGWSLALHYPLASAIHFACIDLKRVESSETLGEILHLEKEFPLLHTLVS